MQLSLYVLRGISSYIQPSLYAPLPVSFSVAETLCPSASVPISLWLPAFLSLSLYAAPPTSVATLSPCSLACMPLSFSVPVSLCPQHFFHSASMPPPPPPQHLSLYSSAFMSIGVSVSRPLGLYAPSCGHSFLLQLSLYSHVPSVPLFLYAFVSIPPQATFPATSTTPPVATMLLVSKNFVLYVPWYLRV